MAGPFRIGTWNILGRHDADTKRITAPGAVRAIVERNPVDVLCLQEVHFFDERPDPQLVRELAAAGLPHVEGLPLSKSHLDDSAMLGVAVAAACPLESYEVFKLENPGLKTVKGDQEWLLHDKGMVGCTLRTPYDRSLRVYSLHLFPFFEFLVGDDDELVEKMWSQFWGHTDRMDSTVRTILAGDFNQAQRMDAARRWSSRRWTFCFTDVGTTRQDLALDDLALSWAPPSPKTTLVRTFSDHHLAVAEIAL